MTLKINTPLLVFALMIQTVFCGMYFILPPTITSSFTGFANQSRIESAITGMTNPKASFNFTNLTPFSCDYKQLYFDCIGTPMRMFIDIIVATIKMIVSVSASLFTLIVFFLIANLYVISGFPIWIYIPLAIFLALLDLLIISDIFIVLVGMLPTK